MNEQSKKKEYREMTIQEIRERNMAEMRIKYLEIFGKPMPEGGHCHVSKPKPKPKKPRKPRQKRLANLQPTRRSKRILKQQNVNYAESEKDENSDTEDEFRRWRHLAVFNPEYYTNTQHFDPNQPEEETEDFRGFKDEEIPSVVKHDRQRSCYVPTLNPEDVSETMLANICRYSGRKEYDKVNGTTCHQCRQKTLDTKTVCRSGRCVGIRGMFCGPCLKNRYGENVEDALKNKDWVCPPCRQICNCSICRGRLGQAPTGILVPYVKEKGYKSVKDYLKKVEDEDEEN